MKNQKPKTENRTTGLLCEHFYDPRFARLSLLVFCICFLLFGCAKHDPILQGKREPVFQQAEIIILNKDVPGGQRPAAGGQACDYRQDADNIIWNGDKKIFSGFTTESFVAGPRRPACGGDFIYAGLTTGELVKISKSGRLEWIADIYSASNMTGGASTLDIVAAPVVRKNIYAGGLGGEFCAIRNSNGAKIWCLPLSVGADFAVSDEFAFVVAADNNLYAIALKDGAVYWKKPVKAQNPVILTADGISVAKERFDFSAPKQ